MASIRDAPPPDAPEGAEGNAGGEGKAREPEPRTGTVRRAFVLFVIALVVVFASLGVWQMREHFRQQALEALFLERIGNDPIGLPPVAEWVGFDPEVYRFRPLKLVGTFDHEKTILVATLLQNPKGQAFGPGFWVVAPFHLAEGGIIFVNRGFVPANLAPGFADGGAAPIGEVEISGLGRASQRENLFTPGTDFAGRREYLNNIERFSRFLDEGEGPVVPLYLDAGPTPPGALPQGGETDPRTSISHFPFALAWFFLAAASPLLLLVWRQKKP